MIELIIDYREHKLKKHFEKSNDYSKFLKIENLTLGDIIIKYNEKIILLIERKTITDLGASINDGRHREQKFRLLKSEIPKKNILYLIEGELKDLKYGYISKKTLQGAIINTMFRDGLGIYRVDDINETIYFIERLIYKIISDNGKCISNLLNENKNENKTELEYLETKKLAKKEQLTPKLFNRVILLQIPGISMGIAEIIAKEYTSISAIYDKYKEIEKEELSDKEIIKKKELLFADLIIETSTGKNRKLGKVLSKRILEFFTPF